MYAEVETLSSHAEISKVYARNSRDELLVGVRSSKDAKRQCQLDFIGGGKESRDRTPEDVAVRELYEEAGIEIAKSALKFVDVTLCPSKSRAGINVISYYEVSVPDDIAYWYNPAEFAQLFFMPIPEILGELEHAGQRDMLQKYAVQTLHLDQLVRL